MVFLLMFNIARHTRPRIRTHRESCIPFLPGKPRGSNFGVNPDRRLFLQFSHEIRQTMRGFETDEQMSMIRHTSHSLRHATESLDQSAQILVQARPPLRRDRWETVLRAENDVVVEAEIRRGHEQDVRDKESEWTHEIEYLTSYPLASLRDAGAWGRPGSGGVAALNHRLISDIPPGWNVPRGPCCLVPRWNARRSSAWGKEPKVQANQFHFRRQLQHEPRGLDWCLLSVAYPGAIFMSEQHFAEIQRELASLRLEDTLLQLNKLLATSQGRCDDPALHEIVSSRESGVPAYVVHFLTKHLMLNASNLGIRNLDCPTYLRLHDAYFELPDPILSDPNWVHSDPTGFLIRLKYSQLRSQRWNPLQMYGIAASLFGKYGPSPPICGKNIHEHLTSILGMPVETFMRFGFLCHSIRLTGIQGVFTHMVFSKAFYQGIDFCVPEVWEPFLKMTSIDRDGFRAACKESQAMATAPVQHEVNALERYPIIDVGQGHFIAVDPDLVVNRTTSLLYFDLLEQFGKRFQQAFGERFEAFVGELIRSIPGHSDVWSDHEWRTRTTSDEVSKHGRRTDWVVIETALNVDFPTIRGRGKGVTGLRRIERVTCSPERSGCGFGCRTLRCI